MPSYLLHTDIENGGFPRRYKLLRFETARDRRAYADEFAREVAAFDAIRRELGYCPLAIHTSYERVEEIAPDVARKIERAGNAWLDRRAADDYRLYFIRGWHVIPRELSDRCEYAARGPVACLWFY